MKYSGAELVERSSVKSNLHTFRKDVQEAGNKQPTLSICNSFIPFCINSCTLRSSVTPLFSLKASTVRLLAYSRKLYEANSRDWRRSERNCKTACQYCLLWRTHVQV